MPAPIQLHRSFLERNPIAAMLTVLAFIAAFAGLFVWGLQ